jgi:hypothetical protein
MTDYKRIRALLKRDPRAAKGVNEMLATMAAGALAGNADPEGSMSGEGAARTAAEALERILTITEVEEDEDNEDDS